MESNVSFSPSTISLGGYTFPASFKLVSRDQPTTIDEVKIPFFDGSNAAPGTRSSKVIRIGGTIGGPGSVDSFGNYISTRDQAEAELNLMSTYLESGYQPLRAGLTPPRSIQAQKRKSTFTYVEGTARSVIEVDLEFVAPDPRWLSDATTTVGGGPSISTTVTVGGTGITYPVFTFTGPYVNPLVKISPPGGGYVQLALTLTMAAGETLVVDCDPRRRATGIVYNTNVVANAGSRLDVIGINGATNTVGDSAFFPYLRPGSNTIVANGAANGTSVTASWQEAYVF
jgi:hypothetical protein